MQCIGFIPSPREGHAAALVDDVIYVFGGRGVDGKDLGDLAAFKLSSAFFIEFFFLGGVNATLCVQINGGTCSKTWDLHQAGGRGMPWLRWARECLFWAGSRSHQQNRKIMGLSMSWILVCVLRLTLASPNLILSCCRAHKVPRLQQTACPDQRNT